MQSDILMLFKTALPTADLSQIKACLMDVDRSVLVHQKEDAKRVLLVKFDPKSVSPALLLSSVRDAGFDVTMAGG